MRTNQVIVFSGTKQNGGGKQQCHACEWDFESEVRPKSAQPRLPRAQDKDNQLFKLGMENDHKRGGLLQ